MPKRGERKPVDVALAAAMYCDQRMSMTAVGAHFGVSGNVIRDRLSEAGYEIRRGGNSKGCALPRRVKIPEAELRRMYLDEKMNSLDIAKAFGCSSPTVLERLRQFEIPVRHHNDTKRGAPARNRVDLRHEVVVSEYLSAPDISAAEVARKLGVGGSVVARVLREAGIERKPITQIIAGKRDGESNPNWNPELTPEEREKRRSASRQSEWRLAVFERDGYACQVCGDDRGGNLNAHHLEPYRDVKKKRWDVSNGVCVCDTCHRAFHQEHGYRGFTAAQFWRFRGQRMAAE